MEGSVATKEAPPEPTPSFDGAAEATRTTEELFQYAMFVHVGAGALDCEHAEDGECTDHVHFHAWLVMPNVFQFQDIEAKAQAARARKKRALNDTDSDARLVLEDQLDNAMNDPEQYRLMIEQLADARVRPELIEIRHSLLDSDEFEHIDADSEELRRLMRLPEEERDADDFERLNNHVKAFTDEFEERFKTRVDSEKARLSEMPKPDVLDLQRRHAIDFTCDEAFFNAKYTWTYYICARRPVKNGYPTERIFERPEDMKNAAPEAIIALRDAYRAMELRPARSDAAGN